MVNQTKTDKGWTPEEIGSLKGKTFVITGATSGTGYQVVRTLLSKGADVLMLNRNAKKSDRALDNLKTEFGKTASVSYVLMDLSELASVRAAAKKILEKTKKIDVLICNAAIAQVPYVRRKVV